MLHGIAYRRALWIKDGCFRHHDNARFHGMTISAPLADSTQRGSGLHNGGVIQHGESVMATDFALSRFARGAHGRATCYSQEVSSERPDPFRPLQRLLR